LIEGALFAAWLAMPSIGLAPQALEPGTTAVTASASVVSGSVPTARLIAGTSVQLKLEETITTEGKRLKVGDRFRLSVASPVVVAGHVVIPVGTSAFGEVTEVRSKGMWGKSGHLTASLLYVSLGNRQIRLSGSFDDKGVAGTAGVVVAVAVAPIIAFLTTGTSARVHAGTIVTAFIGEDVPLVFASSSATYPTDATDTPAASAAAGS